MLVFFIIIPYVDCIFLYDLSTTRFFSPPQYNFDKCLVSERQNSKDVFSSISTLTNKVISHIPLNRSPTNPQNWQNPRSLKLLKVKIQLNPFFVKKHLNQTQLGLPVVNVQCLKANICSHISYNYHQQ